MTSVRAFASKDKTIFDDMLGVVRRRKAVVVLTALAAILAVYLSLFFVPESYEASTQLEVMLGRENAELPAAVQKGGVYPAGVQKDEIVSYIKLLTGRDTAESVVDALGVAPFRFEPPPPRTLLQYVKVTLKSAKKWAMDTLTDGLIALGLRTELTEREKVVQLLDGAIEATREGDSDVIRVTCRLPNRDLAAASLAVAVQSAMSRNPHFQVAKGELPILETQVAAIASELEGLQNERRKIMDEGGLSAVDRQRDELLQRLHKVLFGLDDKKSQRAAAEARLNELTTGLGRLSMRDQIDQTDVQIAGLRAGIEADVFNADAIDRELKRLNGAADRLELVNLRIDAAAKRYAAVAAQRDSARTSRALDEGRIQNIVAITAVSAAPEPVSPNKLRFVGFGAAGGLVLGFLLATLLEWGDGRIRGRAELQQISALPFLGEYRLDAALVDRRAAPPSRRAAADEPR